MPVGQWFVSARHRGHLRPHKDEVAPPYGVRHARQPGEPFTICGQGALGWIMFWHLPFAPDAPETCERCSELLQLERSWRASGEAADERPMGGR